MLNRLQESDIKLLRVFYAVASCNGFTAAEPVLRMQRPNISAAIKKLEERLDLVLCVVFFFVGTHTVGGTGGRRAGRRRLLFLVARE